ncbi:hypothetical protein Tco_1288890 [Tanacetum coccineum]
MFEGNSYKAQDVHIDLYEALQKSLELDYSNQRLADQEEAHKKRRKRRDVPRTPSGSPPSQPPPLPPPAGASGAPGTSGASGFSQLPPPPPHPSTGTFGSAQQQGTGVSKAQELSPTNSLMQDDSILDEQVHLSDDEDFKIDHLPKADSRKDWWKPLPEEERPATPQPAWIILSSNVCHSPSVPDVECPRCSQIRLIGESRKEIKSSMSTDHCLSAVLQVMSLFKQNSSLIKTWSIYDMAAREAIQMKAASYLDFGLKLLVPEQMWIDDVCTYDVSAKYDISHWWFTRQKFYIDKLDSPSHRKDVRTHMRILSVVRIKAYSRYRYEYLSEIVLRRANHQEHIIAKRDFKNMYPSDFEDLNLLLLQGHLNHLSGSDKQMLSTAVKLWTRNLVIPQRVEDF